MAVTIVVGLWLDMAVPVYGQWMTNAGVFCVFAYVLRRSSRSEARTLWIGLVIGFLGELFLCFGWGLYTYRYENLPLFVPPGHALLFFAGTKAGAWVPRWFPAVVCVGFMLVVLIAAGIYGYTSEVLWFGLFGVAFIIGRDRQVYSVMLVMALALELLGTYWGAWKWAPEVNGLGLPSLNPPLTAGVFYCWLDLMVLGLGRALDRLFPEGIFKNVFRKAAGMF